MKQYFAKLVINKTYVAYGIQFHVGQENEVTAAQAAYLGNLKVTFSNDKMSTDLAMFAIRTEGSDKVEAPAPKPEPTPVEVASANITSALASGDQAKVAAAFEAYNKLVAPKPVEAAKPVEAPKPVEAAPAPAAPKTPEVVRERPPASDAAKETSAAPV